MLISIKFQKDQITNTHTVTVSLTFNQKTQVERETI